MFNSCSSSSIDFSNKILIISATSIGNIGQLTIDILLNSYINYDNTEFEIKKIGYFETDCLLPVLGYNTLDSSNSFKTDKDICQNIEVYSIEGLNIILFQHRSPIIKGKGKTYVDQLSSFIINSRFSKVIIIGGLDSSVQNVEMIGKYLYSNIIISNSQNVMYLSTSNEELPVMNYTGIIINDKSEIQLQKNDILQNSGLILPVLELCLKNKIPLILITKLVSEGDNLNDAVDIVSVLLNYLQSSVKKIVIPKLWNDVLFGEVIPADLY